MRPLARPGRSNTGDAIELARYAEISAYLCHYPADKKDEVLARLGIRRQDWQTAAARWKKDLTAALDQGRTDLAGPYAAAFKRTRRRLESLRPPLESLGPLPGPDGPDTKEPSPPPAAEASAPSSPAAAVPAQPARAELPSYLMISAHPAPAYPASASSLHSDPSQWVTPTQSPALPIAPAFSVAIVDESPPDSQVTQMLRGPVLEKKLPFEPERAESKQAFDNAVAHAQVVQGPARRSAMPLDATVDVDALAAGHTLPFDRSSSRAKSSNPPARDLPDYTVEQYASLRVELHNFPEQTDRILARYHIDTETVEALDEHWRERFDADPALRSTFLEACVRYKAWLLTHGSSMG